MGHATPLRPPGEPLDPSRTCRWASQTLTDRRVGLPNLYVRLLTSPDPSDGLPNASWTCGRASRPLPVLLVAF